MPRWYRMAKRRGKWRKIRDQLATASIAPNTRVAYASAVGRFDKAAQVPADDESIANYLTVMYEGGLAPVTASTLVAALKFRARQNNHPNPAGPVTEQVLAGFRRQGANRGRGQVAGISWPQADTMALLAAGDGSSLAGLRDAAIIAVGSDCLLRVSELAQIDCTDVKAEEDASGRLTVRHSKTDQEGVGTVLFLGAETLARVMDWRTVAGICDGPLFRAITPAGVGTGHLTPRTIRSIICTRARPLKIKGRISGHSLRVGSTESLATAGASLAEMQVVGRWESPAMPGRYARRQLAGRGAMARFRYRQG